MKNTLQHAFILHSKPYKEQSSLVELFTPQGRLRAVFRKARTNSGSISRPFIALEINIQGKTELKTITKLEALQPPYLLQGNYLFTGLYLNELLVRLLPLEDPYPNLFNHYQNMLTALVAQRPLEPLLRGFEWSLLTELGYGFPLDMTASGDPIVPEGIYYFNAECGLQQTQQVKPGCFQGTQLLAMSQADWSVNGALAAAKRLMRQVFAHYLQGKPLLSRDLFLAK